MKWRSFRHSLVLACLLAVTPVGLAHGQQAAETPGRGWTPQALIPQYSPLAMPPTLVQDGSGVVHAFTSMPMSEDEEDPLSKEVAIYYRQWTLEGGWTEPVDILLAPVKLQARFKGVYLDPQGTFHLVFYAGDEWESNIYYSSAPVQLAGNAHAWSTPVPIGPLPITPDVAGIVGDADGNLVVVYAGNLGEGNSLYAVTSPDSGATWTEPLLIYSTYSSKIKPFDFQMRLGASGVLHVVWNVTDQRGQNVDGFYMRLADIKSENWSVPISIDTPAGLGVAIPAVIEHDGRVFLVYNNGHEGVALAMQWFRMSDDLGATWSQPIAPWTTHIGRNGAIEFLVDSSNRLHVFFGQRIPLGGDEFDAHGMWESIWSGTNWESLTPVVSGLRADNFGPYDARGVVNLGNTVLLTWRTDPGFPQQSTWYSVSVLDSPALPAEPVPPLQLQRLSATASLTSAGESELLTQLAATHVETGVSGDAADGVQASARVEASVFSDTPATSLGPGMPIWVGLLPSIVFTILVLGYGGLRRRRNAP